jgi:hypothetical protein
MKAVNDILIQLIPQQWSMGDINVTTLEDNIGEVVVLTLLDYRINISSQT